MKLSVLTFNAWGLPWPVSRHLEARIPAIAEEFARLSPDVGAFQEVWTPRMRQSLIEAARLVGYEHFWHREPAFGGSGLLVISRLPILEARFHPYLLNGLPQRLQHSDYWGGKGFADLTLQTGAGPIRLVDTHLHAAYGRVDFRDEYLGHRVAQIVQLADALATIEEPIALAGDLNFYPNRFEARVFAGLTGLRDVAAEVGNAQETGIALSPYKMNQSPPGNRFDYVWARDGRDRSLRSLSARRVLDGEFFVDGERATFSDHAGVLAQLEVEAGGSGPATPSLSALELARQILRHGREVAEARRNGQRRLAGVGGVLSLGALAGRRSVRTRRGLVRALALGVPVFGLLASLGWGVLAEGFTPGELRGYDEVDAMLERLSRKSRPRDSA